MDHENAIHTLHVCLRAQGAMMCALARSNPQPDTLRQLFDEEAKTTLLLAHAEGAGEGWLNLLRQMLDQCRAHVPATPGS